MYCKYKWSFPKNSMMTLKGYTKEELENLPQDEKYYYTILSTYNKKKSDNSIFLTVDFDGTILEEVISPKFLKDGESGTNGSKYSALITYKGKAYGEVNEQGKPIKCHIVYLEGKSKPWNLYDAVNESLYDISDGIPIGQYTNLGFNIELYKDGELVIDNSSYSIEWELFDSRATDPCFEVSGNKLRLNSSVGSWNVNTVFCNR